MKTYYKNTAFSLQCVANRFFFLFDSKYCYDCSNSRKTLLILFVKSFVIKTNKSIQQRN